MRKLIKMAFFYALFAIAAGVFFREFTKMNGFTGITVLSTIHVHLFVLGMVVFLVLALFEKQLHIMDSKKFKPFFIFYNVGVIFMVIMLFYRGIGQVFGTQSTAMAAGISGVAHSLLTVGVILLFLTLLEKTKELERAE